jgi:ribosomal protein S7
MKNNSLKHTLTTTLMKSGNKKTGEKILLKSLKFLQKSTFKKHTDLIQLAIINSTPTFKVNQQILKKGKRKSTKDIPTFIKNNSLRIVLALKFIKESSNKSQSFSYFYQNLAKEILLSSELKGQSIEKKGELHQQILLNKKYLFKFRW